MTSYQGYYDDPQGWYDDRGDGEDDSKYTCEWYCTGDFCGPEGHLYENFDKTAVEACACCGGGTAGPEYPTPE